MPDTISYDVDDLIPPPDGSHVARIVPRHDAEQPAGTASYDVVVGERDEPREKGTVVFSALDGMPVVTWPNDYDLSITLAYLSRVRTSLHGVGDVAISYKLADRLRDVRFHDDLHRWEQQAEEGEQDEAVREVRRRVARQAEKYNQCQAWVQANVPDGGR